MASFLKKHIPSVAVGVFASLIAMGLYVLIQWVSGEKIGSPGRILMIGVVLLIVIAVVFEQAEKRIIRPRIWKDRHKVDPSFDSRIESSKRSIYLIGFTFEAIFINYGEMLGEALKKSVDIRLLVLNPDSLHAEAHEEFRKDVRDTIRTVLSKDLKPLYDKLEDKLSPADLGRFTVRATNYLPRFSASIFEGKTMLLNFYLYGRRAQENPVIELRLGYHREAFNILHKSLNEMWKNPGNQPIIENGKWVWKATSPNNGEGKENR